MTDEQVKKYLDPYDWEKYQNGSDKFKSAVKLGLKIQLAQIDNLFNN